MFVASNNLTRDMINGQVIQNNDFVDEYNMYDNVEILFLYLYYFTIRVCFIDLVYKIICMINQTISFLKQLTDKVFKTMIMWGSICKLILNYNSYTSTFFTLKVF